MPRVGPGTPSAASKTPPWWVVFTSVSQSIHPASNPKGLSPFHVLQAQNKQLASAMIQKQGLVVTSVNGPFATKADAEKDGSDVSAKNAKAAQSAENKSFPNVFGGFFSGLGGMLGAGIESGLVSFFKDLWNVIVGPLEIVLGSLVVFATIAIYFKDDIGTVAGAAAMAA